MPGPDSPSCIAVCTWDQRSMCKAHDQRSTVPRNGACSFAVVIQQLPLDLRDALCIFYLVLRALDTVEDDMAIPVPEKLPTLLSFHEKIYDRLLLFEIQHCPLGAFPELSFDSLLMWTKPKGCDALQQFQVTLWLWRICLPDETISLCDRCFLTAWSKAAAGVRLLTRVQYRLRGQYDLPRLSVAMTYMPDGDQLCYLISACLASCVCLVPSGNQMHAVVYTLHSRHLSHEKYARPSFP